MTASGPQIVRATLAHTPRNPFFLDEDDPRALVSHEDGGLLFADGRIIVAGDFAEVASAHAGAPVVDLRGSFVLPGFIDTHVHYPQLRIIGSIGLTLLDWLERVAIPEECRMADPAYASETAGRFLHALASHGTTTGLVFGPHFAGAAAELFEAAGRSGLRIISGLTLSDRRLRPELHARPADAHRESSALIERYHGRGRIRYAVTPRFALSTSEAILEVCQQLVRDHPDVLVQTHINENLDEIGEVRQLFPWAGDYLAVYERYGLSRQRSVMAHNVHVTSSELQRLAAAGTAVAHCPCSNLVLGSGAFPMKRHIENGVTCALGTDVGGGTGFGIPKEALHAYMTQRLVQDPQTLNVGRLLYLATGAGAKALCMDDEIGDFQQGKAADFVCLRPPSGSVLEAAIQRAAHVEQALASVFTMADQESVEQVCVGGEVVFARGS